MLNEFVRNRVRDETSDIAKSFEIVVAMACDAGKLIDNYFGRSRKLTTDGFRNLVAQIDQTVVSGLRPVRRKISVRPATAARPKSDAHELFYLFVLPEERPGRSKMFRLTSLRVLATRKKVIIECVPTHFTIRQHAASRFIERGTDSARAIRFIASSLAEWSLLPSIVDDVLVNSGYEKLALPCRSAGMLMGYIDSSESIPSGVRFIFDKTVSCAEPLAASPLTPLSYVVATYIGPAEIRDNQIGAIYLLEEWRRAVGTVFDDHCEAVYWPVRNLVPATHAPLSEELRDQICAEIITPRMLRAMGNKRYADVSGTYGHIFAFDDEGQIDQFERQFEIHDGVQDATFAP